MRSGRLMTLAMALALAMPGQAAEQDEPQGSVVRVRAAIQPYDQFRP